MRTISLLSVVVLALGTWAFAGPAYAQGCPPGYYYASDGNCYPGPPPTYPAPVYNYAPPVYQPPPVFDGFALGLGLTALVAILAQDHGRDNHGRQQGRRGSQGYDRGQRGRH